MLKQLSRGLPWCAAWQIHDRQVFLDQYCCMFLVRLVPDSVGSPRQDSVLKYGPTFRHHLLAQMSAPPRPICCASTAQTPWHATGAPQ